MEKITILLSFLNNNFNNVLFSSELNNEKINYFFSSQFNTFDYKNNKRQLINKKNIFFLKDVDGYDLFDVVKKSSKVVCPEGIISHMAYFLNKDLLTLMHFNLKNKQDFIRQIISCKEWFPQENYPFCVLKKDFEKSIKKIKKRF